MKPTVPFRSRHPFLSALEDRRVLILLVLLLVLMAALVLGACLGSTWESPFQVLLTMAGVQSDSAFVIGTLRLPRLVLALLAGAGLSLAGAVLQGLIRNPLASPDVLGMTGALRPPPSASSHCPAGRSAFAGCLLLP